MANLSGKVALVTGGSVGKALARAFLDAGSNVGFVYRNQGREKELRDELAGHGGLLELIRADLSSYQEAKRVADSLQHTFGGIDFLLNSLGGWLGGKKLHEHSDSELQRMFSMGVVPTFNIMSAVLPVMAKQNFGRVVNFISMQVFGTGAGNSVYAASKGAVHALSKAAAEEYKHSGISVCMVAPSTIDTAANRKSMPNADTSNWVKVEEIASAILFFCSTGDSINGTVLQFSGK
jgi:NAD(P)-dependent dehydrogenase (short-subunit alcohol dehydrogenase family)